MSIFAQRAQLSGSLQIEESEEEVGIQPPQQQASVFQLASDRAKIKEEGVAEIEKPEISRARSLISAPVKGISKELIKRFGFESPHEAIKRLQETPFQTREQQVDVETRKLLPTKDKFIENTLEKAGKLGVQFSAGGIPNIIRTTLAATVSEGLKAAGAPEIIQDIGEVATFIGPGLAKKITATKAQAPLVDFARKMGLSEKEITPLIQGEGKQKFLAWAAKKGGRAQRALQKSYEATGNVYDVIRASPEALKPLEEGSARNIIQKMEKVLLESPSAQRNKIAQDFTDLKSAPLTVDSLINFFQDVNKTLGPKIGKLSLIKGPIIEGMKELSPKLAEDFQLTNQLFANRAKLAQRLKPTLFSQVMKGIQAVKLATGLAMGNIPLLYETVGESAGRIAARELLINPRLQNLSRQMGVALNKGKFGIATKIADKMATLFKPKDPTLSKELKKADFRTLRQQTKKGEQE